MITRPFGSTGCEVAVVGQGTWKLRDPKKAARALAEGLELGLTHVDTAELYSGAEEVIAPVIRDRRDDVFLVSKVLPSHGSRAGVHEACEASLRRLGTDHLDVYLLHWPGESHPLEETMGALGELVDRGLTRFVGVSNFEADELDAAQAALGSRRIACNQVLYHLGDRSIEHEVLPYCEAREIAVVGYSPLGSGDFPPGDKAAGKALQQVADRQGRTKVQIALAFLTRRDALFTIPKAEDVAHVRDNALATGWALTAEDLAELEAAFPAPGAGPIGVV